MNLVWGIIVGLVALMALVVAHEFGHFLAARRNGVKVNEFGIGFPPRAIAWKKDKQGKWRRVPKELWEQYAEHPPKEMIFSLNWLPIGGFCAMDGENASDKRKGTFGASSFWAKTKILFAGVGMNWLIAALILTILAWTGMPQFIANQFQMPGDSQITSDPVLITEVMADSPAATAGLAAGDYILAIDGQSIITGTDVINLNDGHAGETLTYTIATADGQQKDVAVTLNGDDAEYLLGVTMSSSQTLVRSTWSAPIVGVVTTAQLTGETFRALGDMVVSLCSGVFSQFSADEATRSAGQADIAAVGDSVSGPVGIIGTLFPAFTQAGPTNLAFLVALISVSLACMNVLPIPALDGGRWLLIAIYKLRKKPLTPEVEEKIVSRAFMVLLGLIVIITILDVVRLF